MAHFRLIFIALLFFIYRTRGVIPEKKRCADPTCTTPISLARTLLSYMGDQKDSIAFRRGEVVKVLGKCEGPRTDLWEIEFKGKRGYAPKGFLQEFKILVPKSKVTHIVPTDVVNRSSTDPEYNGIIAHPPLDSKNVTLSEDVNNQLPTKAEISPEQASSVEELDTGRETELKKHSTPFIMAGVSADSVVESSSTPDGISRPHEVVHGTTIYFNSDDAEESSVKATAAQSNVQPSVTIEQVPKPPLSEEELDVLSKNKLEEKSSEIKVLPKSEITKDNSMQLDKDSVEETNNADIDKLNKALMDELEGSAEKVINYFKGWISPEDSKEIIIETSSEENLSYLDGEEDEEDDGGVSEDDEDEDEEQDEEEDVIKQVKEVEKENKQDPENTLLPKAKVYDASKEIHLPPDAESLTTETPSQKSSPSIDLKEKIMDSESLQKEADNATLQTQPHTLNSSPAEGNKENIGLSQIESSQSLSQTSGNGEKGSFPSEVNLTQHDNIHVNEDARDMVNENLEKDKSTAVESGDNEKVIENSIPPSETPSEVIEVQESINKIPEVQDPINATSEEVGNKTTEQESGEKTPIGSEVNVGDIEPEKSDQNKEVDGLNEVNVSIVQTNADRVAEVEKVEELVSLSSESVDLDNDNEAPEIHPIVEEDGKYEILIPQPVSTEPEAFTEVPIEFIPEPQSNIHEEFTTEGYSSAEEPSDNHSLTDSDSQKATFVEPGENEAVLSESEEDPTSKEEEQEPVREHPVASDGFLAGLGHSLSSLWGSSETGTEPPTPEVTQPPRDEDQDQIRPEDGTSEDRRQEVRDATWSSLWGNHEAHQEGDHLISKNALEDASCDIVSGVCPSNTALGDMPDQPRLPVGLTPQQQVTALCL